MQTIIYALLLLPACALPYAIRLTGSVSLLIMMIATLLLVIQCIRLYREMDAIAARRVMFGSYIYLPVILLAMLADKI
jgi:protoheme IX farnesyltransferase